MTRIRQQPLTFTAAQWNSIQQPFAYPEPRMEELLILLLWLITWPYRTWKESIENSRLGASPMELETLRFWKRIAIWVPIVTLLAFAAGAAWVVLS